MAVCTSVLLLALALPAQGPGPKWCKSWQECLEQAKAPSKSILVCFAALQWDPASADFLKKVIQDQAVALAIDANHVPIHFDLILKPDRKFPPAVANQGRGLAKQFGFHGVHCVPRVILVTRGERVYGRVGPVGAPDEFLRWLREWEEARPGSHLAAATGRAAGGTSPLCGARRPEGRGARAEALAAAKEDPANAGIWDVLAMTAGTVAKPMEIREWMAALANPERLGTAAAPDPAQAGRWFRLGEARAAARREAEALFCYRQSMAVDPASVGGGLRAAALAARREENADALRGNCNMKRDPSTV